MTVFGLIPVAETQSGDRIKAMIIRNKRHSTSKKFPLTFRQVPAAGQFRNTLVTSRNWVRARSR